MTTELLRTKDGPMLGNAVLCLAELVGSMEAHVLYELDNFLPAILNLLKIHCHQNVPDSMVVSIVTALQKIVESVGNFLSPYLNKFLSELTILNSLYTDTENPKVFYAFVFSQDCKKRCKML